MIDECVSYLAEGVLGPTGASARASGKTILLGEHAVVYGHPALALALRNVPLRVVLGAPTALHAQGSTMCNREAWEDGIRLRMRGKSTPLPREMRRRFREGFEIALRVTGTAESLSSFAPQPLLVDTEIPLGAGMGGSAAMSTAFVRLALEIRSARRTGGGIENGNVCEGACRSEVGREPCACEPWDALRIAAAANDVDSLFHGNASGLDAAAVSSDGVIHFRRGEPPSLVLPGADFHLVLVDSGERASTAEMVARISRARESAAKRTSDLLETIGSLTREGRLALEGGDLKSLGHCLDGAHEALRNLDVSTPRMDALCSLLRKRGALGAKLTGAGGGGLVLALFTEDPIGIAADLREHGEVFITSVRK